MSGLPVAAPTRRTLLGMASLLVPGVTVAGCASGVDDVQSRIRTFPAGGRRAAPTLTGTTLTGTTLSTASWAGKPVVVNVWGSWCQPCHDEAPAMAMAAKNLMARGVEFLGLDTRESGGTAAALVFVATYGIPFPSLVDTNGSLILALSGVASLSAPPATVVLDARHRVAAVVNGTIGGAVTLEDVVHDATAGAA